MFRQNSKTIAIVVICVIESLMALVTTNAHAVPSFKRQTGMDCAMCHTVFPELTPFGRIFKLSGYVLTKSTKLYEVPPPIAGMAQLSFTRTDKSQPRGFTDDNWATRVTSSGNDVVNLPQQLSLFYGGRIFYKIGGFVQGTFDGVGNNFFLDNTDIRYADSTTVGGENLIYGVTLNNNPTVQDVWNTTPAFGFPFAKSSVAPTPAAVTIIDGTLASQVGGLGAYGFWNNLIYGEVTLYRTTKKGLAEPLGAGTTTDMVLDNLAPYWRFVLQHQWGNHSLSAGTYGTVAKIFPQGNSHGPTDQFTDIALDAQYQYIGDKHLFSAQTTWIHEKQDWDASFGLGNAANPSDSLNTFRTNLNYFYKIPSGRMGGSAGYFSTTGNKDILLYSPGQVNGSRTGTPNSNGFILELDYLLENLPWGKAKVSLQYTLYNKFNGAHSNYDGFGRDASDNNTLFFLIWLPF
jgi:hypothetical protein